MKSLREALEWRYATKQFDPAKEISEEQLGQILESLRLSPSSFGLQPWKFVIVRDPQIRKQLVGHSWGQSQVADASHLIVLCALREMTPSYVKNFVDELTQFRGLEREALKSYEQMMLGFIGRLSPQTADEWMKNQVYIALGFLMYEAAIRGIDSCPMEGFDSKKFDELLKLEEKGLRSIVLCPIGYRSQNDPYAAQPKFRFPKERVFISI